MRASRVTCFIFYFKAVACIIFHDFAFDPGICIVLYELYVQL